MKHRTFTRGRYTLLGSSLPRISGLSPIRLYSLHHTDERGRLTVVAFNMPMCRLRQIVKGVA